MKNVDYTKTEVPADYVCENCGGTNCKLWREYQTFCPSLMCATCAAVLQGKDISGMDADGLYPSVMEINGEDVDMGRSDQIGWMVPAVPDEEGAGYWGYTSVPQAGCDWWKNLPSFPVVVK